MYGCLRGLLPTLNQAQAEGRTWWYMDNGYFRPGHFAGYYRVTRNAMQHDGTGNVSSERWERLGLNIAPWKKVADTSWYVRLHRNSVICSVLMPRRGFRRRYRR